MANALTVSGDFVAATSIRSNEYNGNTYYDRKVYVDITDNPQYPNKAELVVKGWEKCSGIDNFKKGDKIQVSFNIKGREYEKKDGSGKRGFIQELEIWRIDKVVLQAPSAPAPAAQPATPANTFANGGDDDLPF